MTQLWWYKYSIEYMAEILQCLEEISAQYGLLINKSKMKIIVNRPENNSPQIQKSMEFRLWIASHILGLWWKTQEVEKLKSNTMHRLHVVQWQMSQFLGRLLYRSGCWLLLLSHVLKYFVYVTRAEAMEFLFIQGKVERIRGRGCSSTRWTNSTWKAMDRNFLACVRSAQNWQRWKELVSQVIGPR